MATSIDKSAETATVAATIEVSKEAKACKNNRLIVFLKTEVMGYLLTCLLAYLLTNLCKLHFSYQLLDLRSRVSCPEG
jgi:hypothetical protein